MTFDLTKERHARTLFEDIKVRDANVTAKTLMDYLSFLYRQRDEVEPHRFATIANLFHDRQFQLVDEYETRIGYVNKMNTALMR